MAQNKKVTLHPTKEDGSIDTKINLFPKTNNFVNDSGDPIIVAEKDYVDEAVRNIDEAKQDTLIAGENITIENNVISANSGGTPVDVYTKQECDDRFATNDALTYKTLTHQEILTFLETLSLYNSPEDYHYIEDYYKCYNYISRYTLDEFLDLWLTLDTEAVRFFMDRVIGPNDFVFYCSNYQLKKTGENTLAFIFNYSTDSKIVVSIETDAETGDSRVVSYWTGPNRPDSVEFSIRKNIQYNNFQDKLIAGENITITNNVIDVKGDHSVIDIRGLTPINNNVQGNTYILDNGYGIGHINKVIGNFTCYESGRIYNDVECYKYSGIFITGNHNSIIPIPFTLFFASPFALTEVSAEVVGAIIFDNYLYTFSTKYTIETDTEDPQLIIGEVYGLDELNNLFNVDNENLSFAQGMCASEAYNNNYRPSSVIRAILESQDAEFMEKWIGWEYTEPEGPIK